MIFKPQGELTREFCMQQIELARTAVVQGARQIDLSDVVRVDSTAIAFWLDMRRWSADRQIDLSLINAPDQLLSIAELVGVESLIAS